MIKGSRMPVAVVTVVGASFFGSATALAQSPCNPSAMPLMIQHFQLGQAHLPSFAWPVRQLILQQTGGTTYYPQLGALGPLQNINVEGAQALPNGTVCGFSAQFAGVKLLWQVAYGADGLIYGLNYTPAPAVAPSPDRRPAPTPPGPTGGTTPALPTPGSSPVPKERRRGLRTLSEPLLMSGLFSRRKLLTITGGAIGCSLCGSPPAIGQSHLSIARSGGCWMGADEASPLISAADQVISYASGNEPVVLKSGNAVFDRSLARSLARMTALFGVLPGFAYFNEGAGEGSNAYATSAVRLGRDDGTVLFGTRMLRGLLARPKAPDAAVLAVCAHEYGHILQYRRGVSHRLNAGQSTVKRQELHADYLAGYFAGVRKMENEDFSSVTFATTMYDLGDTAFRDRNHHGTHDERAAAVVAGFRAKKERGLSVDQAVAHGLAYVGA